MDTITVKDITLSSAHDVSSPAAATITGPRVIYCRTSEGENAEGTNRTS